MWSRNNQASKERNQRKIDSGTMSEHYPDVSSITINIIYKQKGVLEPIRRVLNFSPGSYAFFTVDCLSEDCVDGGFDLSSIITSMIRNHSNKSKGELGCNDTGPRPDHSAIEYDIQINFS